MTESYRTKTELERLEAVAMERLGAKIAARTPEESSQLAHDSMVFHYEQAARLSGDRSHLYPDPEPEEGCRVYWGSHGCDKMRGHLGGHECACCDCDDHCRDHEANGCVARPPYYGPDTRFYGEDAEALGLPGHDPE